MEASDMLDVVHYFLDEDMRYSTLEELKIHGTVRKTIFGDFYGTPYKYSMSEDSSDANDFESVKPYIPPTEVNPESHVPFGSVLDSPLA
jgi:hypothetical protein